MTDNPRWAAEAISELQFGRPVKIQAVGESMKFLIPSGSIVTLNPIQPDTLFCIGMVVLVVLPESGAHVLHQIGDIDHNGPEPRYSIQSTRARVDGLVRRADIVGVCVGKTLPSA